MLDHDKKEIEKIKNHKKEYLKLQKMTQEERIKRFLAAMRGEKIDKD